MIDPDRAERAASIIERTGAKVRRGMSLAPLTTFRIGGPAALYVEPDSESQLFAIAESVAETGIRILVIGKGSNLLVADEGFSGLVVRLGRGFRWVSRDGSRLTAGGSMPLPALAGVALRHGLAGLEFGVAIPATLGGAVVMNAGAHTRDMSAAVESVAVFNLRDATTISITNADMGYAYRHSSLAPGNIVIGAALGLQKGEPEAIREAMEDAKAWRRQTQPLAEPNCGSVFTNPQGDHAARLIENAGGKGLRVGGASVSEKHANFVLAGPGATASDVRTLIAQVQTLVRRTAGISLETEVRFVGGPNVD